MGFGFLIVVPYLKHSSATLRGWQQDAGVSLHTHCPDRSVCLASELEWRRSAGQQETEGSQTLAPWGKVAHDSFPFLGSGSDR